MRLHGRDLSLGIALQQVGGIPPGDQLQAVPLQDRRQLLRRARELAAELDAGETRILGLLQAGVERDEIAQPGHAVIGPADRVDAETYAHETILATAELLNRRDPWRRARFRGRPAPCRRPSFPARARARFRPWRRCRANGRD